MARPIRQRDKWRIRWLDGAGIRQSAVFDDYREAQSELRKRQLEAEEVRRGLREAPAPPRTFDELADYWIEHRASRKRSRKDDESIIRVHLRPAFGGLRLRQLGLSAVDEFIGTKLKLDPKTLHNVLTLLISMLRLGRDLGWMERVPAIKKPRLRVFDRDFAYLRSMDEIGKFLIAARAETEKVHALYATAIYSGLRAGELAGLQWGDVDFEKRLITVQRSYDGLTKSGEVRYVPIVDALLPILRAWRLMCPLAIVFPNEHGRILGRSARVFQEVLHRVLDRAGLAPVIKKGKKRPYVRFHDLRHTFASHYVMRGGDIFRLQRILGHKSISMTQRYAHLAPDVFAGDHARFGPALTMDAANVVSIADARTNEKKAQ